MKPAILGISGPVLTPDEQNLFRQNSPTGIILFARNIQDPEQLADLTAEIRAILPYATLMVDQEGGRVARLRPPSWPEHPAAAEIGALPPKEARRAAWLTGALIGSDCAAMGLDAVCAPVLDLSVPGAHAVIGDRAYSTNPAAVAALGRAMADGLLAAGVQPVGKHAPGHGRAMVDSHHSLPTLDNVTNEDLYPFTANADLPWLMTAHIVYRDLDFRPATLSPVVIETVIRGHIGFGGVLVSDDLHMRALNGAPGRLAAQALAAGCDIALHCSGDLDHNAAVLQAIGPVAPQTIVRLRAARALARQRRPLDPAALMEERATLLPCSKS